MESKKALELLIDSIEEIKDDNKETNKALQSFKIEVLDKMNINSIETNKMISGIELSSERNMQGLKDGLIKEVSSYKDSINKRVNANDLKVSLLNQKVAMIAGSIALTVSIIIAVIQVIFK